MQQSVASFERAIALDPRFARAHAALATALQLLPFFVGDPPDHVSERTVRAARRALELDSTLADAHVALGSAYATNGRWDDADAEFRHAVALEPDNVAARQTFARWLVEPGPNGRWRWSSSTGPASSSALSPLVSAWLAYAFFISGQKDSALAQSARAIQLDSTLASRDESRRADQPGARATRSRAPPGGQSRRTWRHVQRSVRRCQARRYRRGESYGERDGVESTRGRGSPTSRARACSSLLATAPTPSRFWNAPRARPAPCGSSTSQSRIPRTTSCVPTRASPRCCSGTGVDVARITSPRGGPGTLSSRGSRRAHLEAYSRRTGGRLLHRASMQRNAVAPCPTLSVPRRSLPLGPGIST